MGSTCIWQIYFKDEQAINLDPSFEPFNNAGVQASTLEFDVFQRLWRTNKVAELHRWGALSWKFFQKTGLTGQELLEQINAHPDVDVFYMNPYPKDEGLFESSWVQGEVSHPGLLRLAQAILRSIGIAENDVFKLMPSKTYSVCNYFIGNDRFWSAYIPFVEMTLEAAQTQLPEDALSALHSKNADWRGLHNGATYVPFVVERLFGVFMQHQGRKLKGRQVVLTSRQARLSAALLDLGEMKDMAIRTQSARIVGLWRKARNDYALANYHPGWCERFLPFLNNAPTVF